MPSWSDIFGREVSLSQKITDSWNSYFGWGSDDSDEREDEPESKDTTKQGWENQFRDPWKRMPIKRYSWSKARCMRTDTSPDNDETIEVQVFYTSGDRDAAVAARKYIEGALSESFGGWYDNDVTIYDEPVANSMDDLGDFIEWMEDNNIDESKDCDIILGSGGSAYGGGSSAISPARNLSNLAEGCAKLYGPAQSDGHRTMQTCIHEVGHCLGLPHAHESDWLDAGMGGMKTPMAGGYTGDGTWLHAYNKDVTKDRLDVK